jgi:hypothetical protein
MHFRSDHTDPGMSIALDLSAGEATDLAAFLARAHP